ncbi:hypothetical protein JXQ31_04700 [candidate division KSB1 bacterium]|nr:hypothetical protein [candidate division KSB1 bacterium]
MSTIKKICVLLLLFNIARADDIFIISQNRFISFFPVAQYWSNDNGASFSEVSLPVSAYVPVNQSLGINFRTNQATVSGDGVTTLAGFTDSQIGFSYYMRSLGAVFNLGLNIPSGKKELTLDEYSTSYLISFNHFNLYSPNFGQGLNVSPGLNWAHQLSEKFVIGLAASYQYKGEFKPVDFITEAYKPGDEIILNAGLDFTINETSTLSADFIYTNYFSDKIEGEDVFASGDKFVGYLHYQNNMGFNHLSIIARFRSKAKNSIPVLGELVEEVEKSSPDQYELYGRYRLRTNNQTYLTFTGEIRIYDETMVYSGVYLLGAGLLPQYKLSQVMTLNGQIKYLRGSYSTGQNLTGYEVGVGLQYNF